MWGRKRTQDVSDAAGRNVWLDPSRIVDFLISTRHLKILDNVYEAHRDTLAAAQSLPNITTRCPLPRIVLIKTMSRFDVVLIFMARHRLLSCLSMATTPMFFYMVDSPASGFEARCFG